MPSMCNMRVLTIVLTISFVAIAITGCQTKRSPILVEDSDMVVKFDRTGYEILQVKMRDGHAEGISKFKSASLPKERYTCDNEPPRVGDNCKCGGHTGPAAHLGNLLDCAMLQIDCGEGKFNEAGNSCSHWVGSPPIPDIP